MKKVDYKSDHNSYYYAPMGAEEFRFILARMRLTQNAVVKHSLFKRNTLQIDLAKSIKEKMPLREYWVGLLHFMLGEFSFAVARNTYKQLKETETKEN